MQGIKHRSVHVLYIGTVIQTYVCMYICITGSITPNWSAVLTQCKPRRHRHCTYVRTYVHTHGHGQTDLTTLRDEVGCGDYLCTTCEEQQDSHIVKCNELFNHSMCCDNLFFNSRTFYEQHREGECTHLDGTKPL